MEAGRTYLVQVNSSGNLQESKCMAVSKFAYKLANVLDSTSETATINNYEYWIFKKDVLELGEFVPIVPKKYEVVEEL